MEGGVPESDMWNTFNLGVGFVLVVAQDVEASALEICRTEGHHAWTIGEVVAGEAPAAGLAGLPYECSAGSGNDTP
jgi:phosphoribosylformylglycinamidine cyclo-ligase